MSEPAAPRPRPHTRATVGRLTKLLAGLSVAATAIFGVAVASGGPPATGGDDSSSTVVDDSSYGGYDADDGFDLGPGGGVWPSTAPPAATSGGS
jgi:hypothetical protein